MKSLVVIRDGREQQVFVMDAVSIAFAKEVMLSVQVVCLFLGGLFSPGLCQNFHETWRIKPLNFSLDPGIFYLFLF